MAVPELAARGVMYGVTKVPDDWFEKIPVLGVIYKPKHDAREKHLSLLTPSSSHHSSRHHSRHQSREDHKTSEDGHEHKRRSHKHRHHSSHKSGDRHNDKRRHENKRDPDRHIEHIDTNDQGQRFIAPIAYSPAAYAQSPVSPQTLPLIANTGFAHAGDKTTQSQRSSWPPQNYTAHSSPTRNTFQAQSYVPYANIYGNANASPQLIEGASQLYQPRMEEMTLLAAEQSRANSSSSRQSHRTSKLSQSSGGSTSSSPKSRMASADGPDDTQQKSRRRGRAQSLGPSRNGDDSQDHCTLQRARSASAGLRKRIDTTEDGLRNTSIGIAVGTFIGKTLVSGIAGPIGGSLFGAALGNASARAVPIVKKKIKEYKEQHRNSAEYSRERRRS